LKQRKKIFLSWLWVALNTLVIYLLIPLARAIQAVVVERWDRSLFGYSVIVLTAVAFIVTLYFLCFRLKIRKISNYIWLALTAGTYIYITANLREAPEEAIHFLEYGLLGFFLFRALQFNIKDRSIYMIAFLIGSLVGIFDEIIQWAVPLRYWDLRDVGLNALASGLIQIALWKGIEPSFIQKKFRAKSLRKVSIILATNLILLGLCLSNTPLRVKNYTNLLPFLSFLQKEETMHSFRYKHKDPEIGVFYSRLSIEEIMKMDSESAEPYAQILKEWKDKDYAEFLRYITGPAYPFPHEIRVHVYRRDQRFERALSADDKNTKKKNFFIAYKENFILDKYFGRTLAKSSYKWSIEKKSQAEAFIDKNKVYRSPVSAGLLFTLNEKSMWIFIIAFLVILALANYAIAQKRRKKEDKSISFKPG